MKELKRFVGQTIKNLFLVVWPPDGETNLKVLDISVGLVFEKKPEELYIISTSMEDMWSPQLRVESLPKQQFPFSEFFNRMVSWREQRQAGIIDYEYYNTNNCVQFSKILGKDIVDISLLTLDGEFLPFGIRFLFKEDYILSLSNTSGNTIETKTFNRNNVLNVFRQLGNIAEVSTNNIY